MAKWDGLDSTRYSGGRNGLVDPLTNWTDPDSDHQLSDCRSCGIGVELDLFCNAGLVGIKTLNLLCETPN